MCLVYMTQALDKGALGPVSIMGWLEDVGAQGQDFALTSTLMWIGIICGEPIVGQEPLINTDFRPISSSGVTPSQRSWHVQ
jgi:hypothetical protein